MSLNQGETSETYTSAATDIAGGVEFMRYATDDFCPQADPPFDHLFTVVNSGGTRSCIYCGDYDPTTPIDDQAPINDQTTESLEE